MAKSYTSTVQLRCTKQHTCSSCGCVYAYTLARSIVGSGRSPDSANANMQKKFIKAQREETDMHPCPNCGQYQEDMIGARLAIKRNRLAVLAVIAPIVIPILRGTYALQANTLTWITFLYCGGFLLLQFLMGLKNPNRDREANRGIAANRIVQGTLHAQPMTTSTELLKPDTPPIPKPTQTIAHSIMMILLAGTILLAAAPELYRAVRGWPLNAAGYPPVVGPGDTTRIYMDDSITSIKGFWRGTPEVTCENPDPNIAAPLAIEATTNQNDWGNTIDNVESGEKTTNSHPWVELTFPDAADLAGKTVTCHIDLMVEFPQIFGSDKFQTAQKQMGRDVTLHLASTHAGAQYNGTWWAATLAALLGVFVGSIALSYVARAYKRKAKPTQVFALPPAQP